MTIPIKQTGAILGALTQDPTNNPVAGLVGAGIGYYAASKLDVRNMVKPYSQVVKSLKVSGLSNVNYGNALVDKLTILSKVYDGKMDDQIFEHSLRIKMSNLNLIYNQKYQTNLFNPSDTLPNQLTTAINQLGSIKSAATQKGLLSALSINNLLVNTGDINFAGDSIPFGSFRRGSAKTIISPAASIDEKMSLLKSHLTQSLGHGLDAAEAERIAQSLKGVFSGLPDMQISLGDNLTLTDPTGKHFEFPLQYKDATGARYSFAGNTPMLSNSWNPFGHSYLHKQGIPEQFRHMLPELQPNARGSFIPAAADVVKQFQPIEMLAGFDAKGNVNEQLYKMQSEMNRLFHNASNFAIDPNDPMAMNISARTNLDYSWNDKRYGGEGYTKLSRAANKGEASDFDRLMIELGKDLDNPMSLNPSNDVSSVSAIKAIDPSIAADNTRRPNVVTNRDYLMTQGNIDVIEKYTGLNYHSNMMGLSGLGNAQEFSTLLVDDELSMAISHVFGDKYTIADGAGLYTNSADFDLRRMVNLDFPNIGTENAPRFNISQELLEQLASKDKKGRINPSMLLGINSIGEAIHLGKEYSHGDIVSATRFPDSLRISVEARYVPKEWVKIFSDNAKSGQTLFGETNRRARMNSAIVDIMQRLKDRGLMQIAPSANGIDFTLNGKTITHVQGNMSTRKELFIELLKATQTHFVGYKPLESALILNRSDAGYKFVDKAIKNSVGMSPEDALASLKSAYMDQLFIENKASRSAFINLIDNLLEKTPNGYMDDVDFMHKYVQEGGYATLAKQGNEAKAAFRERIGSIVDKTFTHLDDFSRVKVLASADLGPAIRGAGNEGAMSWLERLNLKLSGYTEADLGSMAQWNKDALHELQLMTSSSEMGKDFNAVKLQYADILSSIHSESAHMRAERLKPVLEAGKIKYNEADNFVSYTLTHSHMGYKSIPITFVETGHSRHINLDEEDILSSLEAQRSKVIRADIELSRYANSTEAAGRVARLAQFKAEVEQLDRIMKRAASGDNNVVKNALRGIMEGSEIQIARSFGGEFSLYASQRAANRFAPLAAYNMHSINKIASGYGLQASDLVFEKKGSQFSKVLYKDKEGVLKPLMALMTREPAQGPGSSLLVEAYLHRALPKDDAFTALPQIIKGGKIVKNAQEQFAFGDYDSDTYKTASLGRGISIERIEQLAANQRNALAAHDELVNLSNAMAIKGKDKALVNIETLEDYGRHIASTSLQAIQRKGIAPEATDAATRMAESLELHLSSLKDSMNPMDFAKRQFAARMAIHNLVENLLKTQHAAAGTVGEKALPMQLLAEQMRNIKGNEQFRQNAGSIIDNAIGHNMSEADEKTKALYAQAKADMLDSLSRYGDVVKNRKGSLEESREALRKGIDEFTASIKGMASNGLLPGIADAETIPDKAIRNTRNLIQYAKDNISNNKKILGGAALGLAATAMMFGSESVDISKDALPLKTSDGILPPIPTEKGYITKGRDYRKRSNSYSAQGSSNKPVNRSSIERNIFNGNPNANVKISDKRSKDIREYQ